MDRKWILVTEKLPIDNKEVEITFIGYNSKEQRFIGIAHICDKDWYWQFENKASYDDPIRVEVVAWRELGEPYSE